MRRRTILLFVITAVLIIPAAAMVFAACPAGLDPGRCFELKGYQVETVPLQGPFPTIDSQGNSVFSYRIFKTTAIKKMNDIDILVPICTPALGNPTAYSCGSTICKARMYSGGTGEPSTGFGFGLSTNNTWTWNWREAREEITLSFTFQGKVYASANAILVKLEGTNRNDYPYGQILAPSCTLVPPPAFPPQVPLATKKEEQIGDVKICSESSDQDGCATKVYTCSNTAYSACNCPEGSKQFWPEKPLADIGIVAGTLQQVWTDPDPRCPTTYIITSGSTCIKRCYRSGYCYVGPPGCTP